MSYEPLIDQDSKDKKKDEKPDEKDKKKEPLVPFFHLFRFTSPQEKLLLGLGAGAALISGAGLPAFSIIFGQMLDDFNGDPDDIVSSVSTACVLYAVIGCILFITSCISMSTWLTVAESQTKKVREAFLRAALRQDIAWFDFHPSGEISSRLANDSEAFKKAIGEKVPFCVQQMMIFFFGIGIGFVKGWQLALIILGITPILGTAMGILIKFLGSSASIIQEAYGKAGAVAEETLSGMRTVQAFGVEEQQVQRYSRQLDVAHRAGNKKSFMAAMSMGSTNLLIFGVYGLCLWFGTWLIRENITNAFTGNAWTGGDVLTVFFSLIMGAFALGAIGPAFEAFASGRAAAFRLYEIIDRQPAIDSLDETGEQIRDFRGEIRLDNIDFSYPTRSDIAVFSKFSLHVKAGETVALVGESGSGKSTIVALLERFYDPKSGRVTVDNVNLKDLNLRWWRDQVGVVRQEPVLNDATIADNIRVGKPWATEDEIKEAAKQAHAHDFIMRLPKQYDSVVGEGGTLLSGGQKQRIALARAIIKNPKVLLLDEATSALDNESERIVQQALNQMMKGRTTIMIAHRLSTVIHADRIFVMHQGKITESGTHSELIGKEGGIYHHLWDAQAGGSEPIALEGQLTSTEIKEIDKRVLPMARQRSTPKKEVTTTAAPETKDEKEEKETYPPVAAGRVWALVGSSWPLIVFGLIGAAITGAAMPVFALVFSQLTNVMFETDPDDQKRESFYWAMGFLGLGFITFIGNSLDIMGFGYTGENITEKIRITTFRSIVRQELGWFDGKSHNSRALGAHLATEATLVQEGTTKRASQMVQIIISLITGLSIAFVSSWQLALVTLSCVPLLALSSTFQIKLIKGFSENEKQAYQQAGVICGEAISNIHTVHTFNDHQRVMTQYAQALVEPFTIGKKTALASGVGAGFGQLVIFGTYGLTWWYGAVRVQDHGLSFVDMTTAVMAVVMAGVGMGQASHVVPNLEAALRAKDAIFSYIDRRPLIDSASPEGETAKFKAGSVVLRNVHFAYPTREEPVLKGLNLNIKGGETVALVGQSGSGKTTVMWLLMHLYDIQKGSIEIDSQDIKNLNVASLRSQFGLVSQEPTLFEATIADNVRVGKPNATMEEIKRACAAANIHEWIMTLPKGYETDVGSHGGQLSGGQKQRVAIARALVRNPKILLLDEATSALDTDNERIVQAALDKLMQERGRTTIVIAHRLSTVQKADKIIVLQNGVAVEEGTHSGLMSENGVYANLVRAGAMQEAATS